MYSSSWFSTFVQAVPTGSAEAEVSVLATHIPLPSFARVLDVGCGTGRVLCPLLQRGYAVTGLDVSVAALEHARRTCPDATLVALDQRHVARLGWQFDAALVLWNSLGFGSVDDDLGTLAALRHVLRPAGRLLIDLYNPAWLAQHQLVDHADPRGARVTRTVRDSRVFNSITYPDASTDEIEFNLYEPAAIQQLLATAGFEPMPPLVWWAPAALSDLDARYQIIAVRCP